MKLFKNILNIIVWTALGLYLLVTFTTNIPAVQEYLGRKASQLLAEKLGTNVSIERIQVGLFNHLSLYNIQIKDQSHRDMLWATRLSARMDIPSIAQGKISIATAQIFGLNARLYQKDADSKPNFQFVLDSLASKDTTSTSPLDLRINSLIIRRSRIKYDRLDLPTTPGQLNANHLNFSDISAHIILKTLTQDSINVNMKRLSLKEQSGLNLQRLSMKLEAGRSMCLLHDFKLNMPHTDISIPSIEASYRFRGDHFVLPSLRYKGTIDPSSITFSDLSFLLPSLNTFGSKVLLSSNFEGKGDDINISSLLVSSPSGDITINAGGWVQSLKADNPRWMANIHDISLSAHTIDFISQNLKGRQADIPPVLTRMGSMHMKGVVNGTGVESLRAHTDLQTDAGDATLAFDMGTDRKFTAQFDTKGINLQRLLDDNNFGQIAAEMQLNGTLPKGGKPQVAAKGLVHQFDYNGYQYKNIDVNGSYSADDIAGKLTIDDPHIGLDIEGQIKQAGKTSDIMIEAAIHRLTPQAIHLSDQWGEGSFSGTISANYKASSIRDAVGSVDIKDFTLLSPQEHYQMQQLHVESGYQDEVHYVTLDSDFGHAEITGDFDYETLSQSFTNFIADKLPTLPGLRKSSQKPDNDFTFNVNIHRSDWIEHLLKLPVKLHQPMTLQGEVNDHQQQISIEGELPHFSYKDDEYRQGHISIMTPINTLLYDLSITKIVPNGDNLDVHVNGSAYNNRLTTALLWDNHAQQRMSGKVTVMSVFDTALDGKQTAHINIAPSTVTIKNSEWKLEPCKITYAAKHIDINDFALRHEQQYLLLNGTASESELDSVSVNMREIDVDYVLSLVDFDAVSFSGLATGTASLSGIFNSLQANARLKVDQFKFENGRMGVLDAKVDWNPRLQQIDIHAIADDGPDAMTYIDGYVTPARDSINLAIRAEGTHLDFAQSFTDSFTGWVHGHGSGAVRLIGPLDAINLTGQLVLNGKAYVKTLGCEYELRNDTLRIVPNEIEFAQCPIYDKYGNLGIMSGGIHHINLTNLTFDIYVDAQNLLAYDFKDFGEDTFYGTVFAQGRAAIMGRANETLIMADVTPQPGTVFVYNAASPDAITNQEFIEWGKDKVKAPSDTLKQISQPKPVTDDRDFRSDFNIQIRINATPDATVRLLMDAHTNDYITLKGTGDLHCTYYNKGGFSMFGTYRITEGTYGITIQNIIKKNFVFNEGGTIVFGGDPYDASLNMQAVHTVNGVSLSDLNVGRSFSNSVRVNCLMNITGQPRQPLVDFDIDMPNVNSDEKQMVRSIINSEEEMNQQVIYLLAVGRFYPQQANNAGNEDTGQSKTSLAMQSLLSGTISGQLNSMLNNVIKSNNWNFGANISTGDEGWNNAEYEGLVSGRMLNNRLLINGQFGYRDNATTATPSFIGDFDIRYLLFPNGNLALKVYNQTNDRYFTRSSLNTQGIGIIMKKDFSGLNDLFGIRKEKKTKQKKDKKVKNP